MYLPIQYKEMKWMFDCTMRDWLVYSTVHCVEDIPLAKSRVVWIHEYIHLYVM